MPDTAFTSFGFPATGAPTSRTLPNRLAEIKNVKDWGAVGDGVTDDTAEIQAAIDYASSPYTSANRGIIFFPPGDYLVSSPLTYESSASILRIAFVGAPGARVFGSVANDAIFKRSVNTPLEGPIYFEGLKVENTHATGKGILLHSTIGGKITNCYLNAFIGIETYNSQCITIDSCAIIRGGGITRAGSVGVIAGNATALISCDISAYENGLRAQNAGLLVHGGRFEVNDVGMYIGIDQTGSQSQCSSFSIHGPSMESNGSGIVIWGGAAGHVNASVSASGSSQPFDFDYGIRVIGGNDICFDGVTVGIDDAYDVAGIAIDDGDRISMNGVSSSSWVVNADVDVSGWKSNFARTISRSANYTTTRQDTNDTVLHPTADNNPRTFTIEANATVPYPLGTEITFVNQINTLTIAITSDTLTLSPGGSTGSRTLAANGVATARKVTTTSWVISGTGLT